LSRRLQSNDAVRLSGKNMTRAPSYRIAGAGIG
jgi:hypothetical protein